MFGWHSGEPYVLTPEEAPDFCTFWRAFRSAHEREPIAAAVRRYDYGADRGRADDAIVDLVIAAVFAYTGFVARQPLANTAVLAVSGFLLALAVIGFITGDTDSGSRSIASLHFPVAINILDLIAGGLGVLSALASIDEPERAPA